MPRLVRLIYAQFSRPILFSPVVSPCTQNPKQEDYRRFEAIEKELEVAEPKATIRWELGYY